MVAYLPPGKREADQLLVLLLRQNGCSVPKGVSSVGDLTSDAVIEAVGSMIPGIDGSPPLPAAFSTKGLHPAERFNTSTVVASRVRDAGFGEPLSAHQLLYPAEEDTRQLLLALLSMLPPDGAPPPPPTPASAAETPLLSETGEPVQSGDLLSSELPHKEAVTEREGGVVDSSQAEGSGEQDIAEAEEEGVGGEGSEGGGERVMEGVAEGEDLEGTASERRAEGSRDAEGDLRESWGEQEGMSGEGGDGGGRGEEEEEGHGVGTSAQDEGDTVEQSQREGTGEGATGASTADQEDGRAQVSPSADEAVGEGEGPREGEGEAAGEAEGEGERPPVTTGGSIERQGQGAVGGNGESGGSGAEPDNPHQPHQEHQEGEAENVIGGRGDAQPGVVLDEEGAAAAAVVVSVDLQSGGSLGSASEGGGVEDAADRDLDPALVGVQRLEGGGEEGEGSGGEGGHEGRPASASLEAHEGEPILEDAASVTTEEEKGRGSAPAEDIGEEGDGGLLKNASPTGGDDGGRKTDPEGNGSRGGKDAGAAALEVAPPQREGGAPDDGRGGDAAPPLGGHTSEAGGGSGAGEGGGDAEGGGAVPTPGVLDGEGVEDDDDVVFLQFDVDAQELELERLLKEEKIASETADELEEEVRRLGTLTEEREKHCRYATKALELLPNVADETAKLQKKIAAAETRMQVAGKAFDKTRRPLEDVVRVQREELARRKARCRALLTDMRSIYAQCEEMARQESLLRVSARDMEASERRDRGEIVVGDAAGEESDDAEWGLEDEVDEETARRRKAGALLRTDIDLRISGLCEDAITQKQEIAISLSEVLDSRREANSAWELLGRSEALSEERLFTAAKEAKSGGGANKDRAKDLTDAYKCLHELDELFSKLVEAVSEVGKKEEEYRVVENETEKLLRRQGGSTRLELLSRDLRIVKGDAFALEQRLDEALEEERQHQRASQEARELEEEEQAQAKLEGNAAGQEDSVDEGRAEREEEDEEENQDNRRWDETPIQAQQEDVEEVQEQVLEEEVGRDEEEEAGRDARGDGFEEDDVRATVNEEVDFVGEDDEENVWQ